MKILFLFALLVLYSHSIICQEALQNSNMRQRQVLSQKIVNHVQQQLTNALLKKQIPCQDVPPKEEDCQIEYNNFNKPTIANINNVPQSSYTYVSQTPSDKISANVKKSSAKVIEPAPKLLRYSESRNSGSSSDTNDIRGVDNVVDGQQNILRGNQNNVGGNSNIAIGNQNQIRGSVNLVSGNKAIVKGNLNRIVEIPIDVRELC